MNLDAMTRLELMQFYDHHQEGRNNEKLNLSRDDTHFLSEYAYLKSLAMGNREHGKIQIAMNLEKTCDGIYKKLSTEARW